MNRSAVHRSLVAKWIARVARQRAAQGHVILKCCAEYQPSVTAVATDPTMPCAAVWMPTIRRNASDISTVWAQSKCECQSIESDLHNNFKLFIDKCQHIY